MRKLRAMLLITVVAAGGLGLFAPSHAVASCVGPSISLPDVAAEMSTVDGEQVPVYTVALGDMLTVDGEYFFVGCNDVVVVEEATHGCSAPLDPQPLEPPLAPAARDVRLVLAQGGHRWTLDTADAADEDELWAITWAADLPADVEVGPATLTADTAELHLIIEPPPS